MTSRPVEAAVWDLGDLVRSIVGGIVEVVERDDCPVPIALALTSIVGDAQRGMVDAKARFEEHAA